MGCSSALQGVPQEILEGASRISRDQAAVSAAGPADCNADQQDEQSPAPEDLDDVDAQCAGVLHGGMDDLGPVQLWDAVMKKYKVAQLCEQELHSLDTKADKSKKDE